MSGEKEAPTLTELRRRYDEIVNDLISSTPPVSLAEVEQHQRATWYCELHEVLIRWVDEHIPPSP